MINQQPTTVNTATSAATEPVPAQRFCANPACDRLVKPGQKYCSSACASKGEKRFWALAGTIVLGVLCACSKPDDKQLPPFRESETQRPTAYQPGDKVWAKRWEPTSDGREIDVYRPATVIQQEGQRVTVNPQYKSYNEEVPVSDVRPYTERER